MFLRIRVVEKEEVEGVKRVLDGMLTVDVCSATNSRIDGFAF